MPSSAISVSWTIEYLQKRGMEDLAKLVESTLEEAPQAERKRDGEARLMWKEQLATNIDLMFLGSIALARYARKHGCKTLLFATRDCCHWHRIFSTMYGSEFKVFYFDCSRNMFNRARLEQNEHYRSYVASLTNDGKDIEQTCYIDIHGTGQRMVKYFVSEWRKSPHCFLLTAGSSEYESLPKESRKLWEQGKLHVACFGVSGSPIEMLNYDVQGSLTTYKSDSRGRPCPVRAPPEYQNKLHYVQIYHDCVDAFVRLLKEQRPHFKRKAPSSSSIKKALNRLVKAICERAQQPIISRHIEHERTHPGKPDKNKKKSKKHGHGK